MVGGGRPEDPVRLPRGTTALLSLLAGWLLYVAVEAPAERWRRRRKRGRERRRAARRAAMPPP